MKASASRDPRQAVAPARLPELSGRMAEVMLLTEDFREERAARLERKALDARTRIEILQEVHGGGPAAGVSFSSTSGGAVEVGGLERARDRRCPRCAAPPGRPCAKASGEPLAADHRARAGVRELERRETWHASRAKGQRFRADALRGCGGKTFATVCTCGARGKARPVGCGVYRVCPSCSVREAIKRRAKFGAARGRVLLGAVANVSGRGALAGSRARWRKGGRYTDKMITLTVPHFDGAELYATALDIDKQGDTADDRRAENARRILSHGSDTVIARVSAAFAAWPIFMRALRASLKARGAGDHLWTRWDRFFEWTPGKDGRGHPHFHVWAFSPFLCWEEVAEHWTAALRAVGVPVRTREVRCERCDRPHVVGARVWVQQLGDFDERAIRELMAGRKALELASFRSFDVGPTATTYAAGWALADISEQVDAATEAALYMALEARRLSQGSAGLYSEDAPPCCPDCAGHGRRRPVLWLLDEERTEVWNASRNPHPERDPPCLPNHDQPPPL